MTKRSIKDHAGKTASILCLTSLLAAAAFAPAQAETLRLGNEGTYPPFSIVDSSGKLTGLEPDLAREMCKRMKVECDIVAMDFKALIPSLLQGKFDLLISQLNPTPERKEKLLLSKPIVYNPSSFVVKKDTDYTFTKEGLAGKGLKIGLQRGGFSIKFVQETLGIGDALEYVYYDNPDQVKLDLLAGRIDMTFDAKINWNLELISKPEGKDWKIAPGDYWAGDPNIPVNERGNAWAVRKQDAALMDKVNATLAEMLADCTYTKFRKVYIDIPILPQDEACVNKTN
jgi:arginine/ornithine transport system substrate-binding protein